MEVIRAENLTKRFVLGAVRHQSIRDAFRDVFRSARERTVRDSITAIDDVNFSIGHGERVGFIGRNGSGKSTLLKVLSRITKPTSGSAMIVGRVGSLLEVGTGFHSELSGRENVFLNGSILGMKRSEIAAKFDEIVAFSEIERFLDTPVKHYSSGMYMRLAFSVAAHLEPDILIVDEVLAVGDTAFQRKCIGKMKEVGESGRTVLFVSHDMQAVTRLCTRAIWLENGRVQCDAEADQAIGEYLHHQSQIGADKSWDASDAPGDPVARLRRVRACDSNGNGLSTADIRKDLFIEMNYEVIRNGSVLVPNIHLFDQRGQLIFISHDWYGGWRDRSRKSGTYVSRMRIPGNFLAEGPIFVTAVATTYAPFEVHFSVPDAIMITVIDTGEDGSARGDYNGDFPGSVRPVLDWTTEFDPH